MHWCYVLFVRVLFASLLWSVVAFNAKAGPYDLLLRHFEECSDIGTGDVRFGIRLKRYNRTTMAADFNMTLKINYDDRISIVCAFAQQTNGGFKQNFYTHARSKVCTIAEQYVPKLWNDLLSALKVRRCPIPKGFYSLKDFTSREDLIKIPAFFYNKYKIVVTYHRNGKRIGCISLFLDVVPKRSS